MRSHPQRRVRGAGRKALSDDGEPGDVDQQAWLDEKLLRKSSAAATRWIVRHCKAQRLIERRRANYAVWVKEMEGVEGAQPLFPTLPDAAVPYVFPLRVKDPEAKYHAIRTSGVPVFRWDIAWPDMPTFEGDEGRAWQTEVFQLGCHQDLRNSDSHDWLRPCDGCWSLCRQQGALSASDCPAPALRMSVSRQARTGQPDRLPRAPVQDFSDSCGRACPEGVGATPTGRSSGGKAFVTRRSSACASP
jgi:hypothetical protein